MERVPKREGFALYRSSLRFEEDWRIFAWIGRELLGHEEPQVAGEIGFLEGERSDVGRIDNILAVVREGRLEWCALEIQAVYFSGRSMSSDFMAWSEHRYRYSQARFSQQRTKEAHAAAADKGSYAAKMGQEDGRSG
ncbi:MAG: hypothetical protein HUU60_01035 [Armatimonadetes bacterium]|nr:hypothetical protein [Armatimonadota bacterium]